MKKLLAVILTLAMVMSMLCSVTVFAADPTFTADKDWENGSYDAEAGTISNGTYTFTVSLNISSKKLTITAFEGPADITEVYIPQFNDGSRNYTTVSVNADVFVAYPAISKIIAKGTLGFAGTTFNAAVTDMEIVAGTQISTPAAFMAECTGLKNLVLTAPTIAISDMRNSYTAWTDIESISLNGDTIKIGGYALSGVAILDSFYVNGTALGEKLTDAPTFKVTMPKEVVRNGNYCVANAYITHLVVGEGTESIGERMYQSCNNITHIDFPDSLKTISKYAFYSLGNVISLDSSIPDDAPVAEKIWDISQITALGQEALYLNKLQGTLKLGISTQSKQVVRAGIRTVIFVNPVTSLNGQNGFYNGLDLVIFEQGAAPTTFGSSWAGNRKTVGVLVYPDSEMESWKAAAITNVTTAMPFGGYVDTFVAGAEGGYDVTYAVANYNAKNIGKAVIALYDDAGAMIGAKTVDASVGTTLTTVNVPVTGIPASAQIFTLGDFNNLAPQYVNYEYVAPVEEPAA